MTPPMLQRIGGWGGGMAVRLEIKIVDRTQSLQSIQKMLKD